MFDIEEDEVLSFSIAERAHQAMANVLEATAGERVSRTIDANTGRENFRLTCKVKRRLRRSQCHSTELDAHARADLLAKRSIALEI